MRCRVTLRFLTRSVFNRFHPVDPARETSSESSGLGGGIGHRKIHYESAWRELFGVHLRQHYAFHVWVCRLGYFLVTLFRPGQITVL